MIVNGNHDAAFGGSIKFCEHNTCEFHSLGELLGLHQTVLTSGCIDDKEHLCHRSGTLIGDSSNLAEFFHEIHFVVEATGGIENDDIDVARDALLAFAELVKSPEYVHTWRMTSLSLWNAAAAGIQAYKVHDPEGHCLELLQFPPDKGDARWHQAAGSATSPFLGIDHSAIANADTGLSARL